MVTFLGLATAVVLLAGCGAGGSGAPSGLSPSAPGGGGEAQLPTVAKDEALARMVPADVAADGKIMVGTDASYPPNEFTASDAKTIIGMDVDMARAVGQKLGLPTEYENSQFDGILPGIQAGKYEMGISSFTVNSDRVKSVDMITYFTAGTKLATLKGNPDGITLDNLCGRNVGVQKGTTQVEDLQERSKKCTDAGKPAINFTELQQQTDVTLALTAKRVSAMLADGPIVAYAISTTKDELEQVGDQYATAPYGIAIAKGKGDFGKAIQAAVQALISDGTYAAILKKWNVSDGAIPTSQLMTG
ncbi:MAG: ABC transporter substrate-binding protein [Pseudonocardia sp.]|nr:ABC transporter substrate-binding protein [Pseudonocardia sp.]